MDASNSTGMVLTVSTRLRSVPGAAGDRNGDGFLATLSGTAGIVTTVRVPTQGHVDPLFVVFVLTNGGVSLIVRPQGSLSDLPTGLPRVSSHKISNVVSSENFN